MKVTSEMVERACQKWLAATGFDYPRDIMRSLLEAALADVPEPPTHGYVSDAQFLGTQARLIDAEAKLEKVQALADALVGGAGNTLRAILDGEP